MEQGYWNKFLAPAKDQNGWFIYFENGETKEGKKKYYKDEQEADEAYQAIIMGRFTKRS